MKIKLATIYSILFLLLLVSLLISNIVFIGKVNTLLLDNNSNIDTIILTKGLEAIPDFELIDGELPD